MAENSYPTNSMIEASARSDAKFDGREFDRLSRADRDRYLERARLSIIAADRAAWRPIEEATERKDGTPVLLNRASFEEHGGGITFGFWYVEEHGEYLGDCGGECRCPEYGEPCEPCWWSEDGGFTPEHPPTHFRSLPIPPEKEEPR